MKRLLDRVKEFSHKTKNMVVAAALLVTPAVAALPASHASAMGLTPAPQVSFTFDDGLAGALTYAAPALQQYGYTGTNYVITGCVGTSGTCPADEDANYMTWAQVTQLKDQYGWEIGSHTVNHPLLASTDPDIQTVPLTEAQMKAELADSKAALAANLNGYNATAFAAPYGDYDNKVRAEAAKLYTSFRGFKDISYNGFPYNDNLIVVQQVQAGVTVAQVKAYVDAAAAANQWLVLVFHEVKPAAQASTDPDDYEYTSEDLAAIAAYVKSKNIHVANMSDGLVNAPTNLTPTGTFENVTIGTTTNTPSATDWVTNNPTNVKLDTGNNGSYPSPTKAIAFVGGATANFLFSPLVDIDQAQTYVIKAYLNVTAITTGEIGLFVHEYNAEGVEVGGKWLVAEPSVFVESLNRVYTPTQGVGAVKASLEIYTTAGSNVQAYVDNVQWLSSKVSAVAGDVNGDGKVNIQDATLISINWNKTPATLAEGDLNNDSKVNIQDATIVALNWSNE